MDHKNKSAKISEGFRKCRKDLLTFLDVAYSSQPNWIVVRRRILESLGRNGFEGELKEFLQELESIGKSNARTP